MYAVNRFSVTNTMFSMWQQPSGIPWNIDIFINYLPHRNEWSVQFSNVRTGLEVYQIYQLFSFCGKVSNVIQRPNHDRTVYVNYESEVDARRCVIGLMQQKSSIRLKPFAKNNHHNGGNNNQNSMNNFFRHQNFGNDAPTTDAGDQYDRNVNYGISRSTDLWGAPEETAESPVQENRRKQSDNPGLQECLKQFKENNLSSASQLVNINPFKIRAEGTEAEAGVVLAEEDKIREEKEPVESVAIQGRLRDQKSQVIIEAQEVIVANVPREFGNCYVLHLLEKFGPIYASEMKTLEKPALRYCHVYFKTPGDAEAAEVDLDGVKLAEKSLIVVRPHTMAEEVERFAKEN